MSEPHGGDRMGCEGQRQHIAGIREYLLAFADDEHLMGQQHTEWIGVAPFLEEDLAVSSIGQDELGHAALLYELVLHLEGVEATDLALDALAFDRPSDHYRCCHLVEYTTNDWAEALVRHWIYDTFEAMRWQLVAGSSLPKLASVARKALQEEAFHCRHADALLDKLLDAPEARDRILEALGAVYPLVEGLCEPVEGEAAAMSAGVAAASTADLLEPLHQAIEARFGCTDSIGSRTASLQNRQNRRTTRSADFDPLLQRMREVLDYDPGAVW